jgi:hypothetical protein
VPETPGRKRDRGQMRLQMTRRHADHSAGGPGRHASAEADLLTSWAVTASPDPLSFLRRSPRVTVEFVSGSIFG